MLYEVITKSGAGFNFVGVTLNIPVSVGRKVCELPLSYNFV